MPSRRRLLLRTLALLVGLTVVMTWPQARHLANGIPDVGDPLLNAWALRWVAHQAPIAPARIFDGNIFYPERWTLAYSEPMLVPGLLSAPLAWLGAGPILVYNLVFLSALVFSGLGTTLLVLELTDHSAGALIAGIVFAFLPFRFDHYSHLQLQQTQFIPLTMWALHRLVTRGRAADGIRLGTFAACTMLSCGYFGIFLLPYLATVALVLVAAELRSPDNGTDPVLVTKRTWLGRTILAGVVAAAVYGVLVAPVARAHFEASAIVGERSPDEAVAGSATADDYLATTATNRVYGRWSGVLGHGERRLFPGGIAVLLALLALGRPWTPAKVAYLAALVIAVDVSLGFNGIAYPALWTFVRPFRGLRVPARMGLFTGFSVAVLAGYGVARLHSKLTTVAARRTVTVVLAVLILTESASAPIALEVVPTEGPTAYADMLRAKGSSGGAVIVEFPIEAGPSFMYYSTFHWQHLLNGYSGFFPPSFWELSERARTFPDASSLAYLRSRGVRFIVIHGELMPPARYRQIVTAMAQSRGFKPLARHPWQHGEISLYRLLSSDNCGTCDEEFASVADAVSTLTVTASRPSVKRGAPIELTYTFTPLKAIAQVQGTFVVMAHFVDANGRVRWIDDHPPSMPTSEWRAGLPVSYTRTVFAPDTMPLGPLSLQAGLYSPDSQTRLALSAKEISDRAYEVASVTIEAADAYEFGQGWFDREGTPTDGVRWRWTSKQATFGFPNLRKDAVLYIDAGTLANRPEPAHVTVTIRGRAIATFDLRPDARDVRRIPLSAAQLGGDDRCALVLAVDRTWSPADLSRGASSDARQLGIRVFNMAVVD